jgi:hypothetical protein
VTEEDKASFKMFDKGKLVLEGDDISWESVGELPKAMPSFAMLFDDRPLGFWGRVKVAWRYIWTGEFVDPRHIAFVEFGEEGE